MHFGKFKCQMTEQVNAMMIRGTDSRVVYKVMYSIFFNHPRDNLHHENFVAVYPCGLFGFLHFRW